MKTFLANLLADLSTQLMDWSVDLYGFEDLSDMSNFDVQGSILRVKASLELVESYPCPNCAGSGTTGGNEASVLCPNCLGTRIDPVFWIRRENNGNTQLSDQNRSNHRLQ